MELGQLNVVPSSPPSNVMMPSVEQTSSQRDSEEPQCVTEGIQIGSIGSAIGILGMWTGAGHVRTKPLGEARSVLYNVKV